MNERISLDYSRMLADSTGGRGVAEEQLRTIANRVRDVHADIERRRTSGELGFLALPYQTEVVEQIRSFADTLGQMNDTIVVLGIGGSALGTIALRDALVAPYWNELDDEARAWFPRLYVLDNVDPSTIGPLLDRLDPRTTLFNVISKSGATAETMAQYMIVRERLRAALDDDRYRGHLFFTTDPEKGVLRRIAEEEGIPTLPVPPSVGGRFSVLSPVGLLPAALVGIDIEALLAGAAAMDEWCRSDDVFANPAAMFAALQYLAHTSRGASVHVMMSYTDLLYSTADWFRQLWAESLGKRYDVNGGEVFNGPTPVKARGATDQHSQVQLYIEGPFDRTITFLAARTLPSDLAIPRIHDGIDELSYLGGRSLGELLDAERVATAAALAGAGRMNMTIELPRIDAHAVGQLLMMLQIATIYAGGLYGVNPLDQPGVELGKRLTFALMGREGYAAEELPQHAPRIVR